MFFYKRLDHTDHVTVGKQGYCARAKPGNMPLPRAQQSAAGASLLLQRNRTILGSSLVPDIEDQRVSYMLIFANQGVKMIRG
jgi:hypothetical protein